MVLDGQYFSKKPEISWKAKKIVKICLHSIQREAPFNLTIFLDNFQLLISCKFEIFTKTEHPVAKELTKFGAKIQIF